MMVRTGSCRRRDRSGRPRCRVSGRSRTCRASQPNPLGRLSSNSLEPTLEDI